MPEERFYCREHLKNVFAERVKLIQLREIPEVKVPRYEELSITKLWPKVKDLPSLQNFFPKKFIEGKTSIDRRFFFAVLAHRERALLQDLIYHGHKNRH